MGGGGTETEVGTGGARLDKAEGVGKSEEGEKEGSRNIGEEWRRGGAFGLEQKSKQITFQKKINY